SMDDSSITPHIVAERKDNHFYDIEHNGAFFYIHTNDKGKNFRIARSRIDNFARSAWEDYIEHDPNRYLKSFDITKQYLILNYKELGLPNIEVLKLQDNKKQSIKFPDPVYTANSYSTN